MTVACARSILLPTLIAVVFASRPALAQEPPPRLPRWVIDLHGNLPLFPDTLQLAESRALNQAELPGVGLGGDLGVHLYPLQWRAITFGIGGQVTAARAHRTPSTAARTTILRPVTERFTSVAPQVSLNFGSGTGWSYLSGGISTSRWSVVPDPVGKLPSDEEALKTINYGGGARWFAKAHLAFSFDVRFYAINPSAPNGPLPSSPRTTLMVIGAGVSVK